MAVTERKEHGFLGYETEIYAGCMKDAKEAGCVQLAARARSLTDGLWVYGFAVPWEGGRLFIVRRDPCGGMPVFEECNAASLQMQVRIGNREYWENDLVRAERKDRSTVTGVICRDKDTGTWMFRSAEVCAPGDTENGRLTFTGAELPLRGLEGFLVMHLRNLDGGTAAQQDCRDCIRGTETCGSLAEAVARKDPGFDGREHLYEAGYTLRDGTEKYALFPADNADGLAGAWKTFCESHGNVPDSVRYVARADRHCRTFADATEGVEFPAGRHTYEIRYMTIAGGMGFQFHAGSRGELEALWENWRQSFDILPESIVRISVAE